MGGRLRVWAVARTLWIGTYPPAGIGTPAGRGEGVYRVALAADGTLGAPVRAVETPAPSFVVRRGAVLYATDESGAGGVAAFRVTAGDGLVPLGRASSGGAYPCHLLLDGDRLYVANYGDGALGVLRLAADGSFADDEPAQVLRHSGSGPRADRQEGPHAHFAALAPGGHLLVVDLGTDEVRRYARTAAGLEPAGVAVTLPPGTGPRHLVVDDRPRDAPAATGGLRAYLTGELDDTVHVLDWDPVTDTGRVVRTLAATATPARPDDEPAPPGQERGTWQAGGALLPSHLALAGDRLLVGVRGAEVLARFTVGRDGLPVPAGEISLPGRCPRHFAVVDGWTVVAEQVPGAVTVLSPDGAVVSSVALPSAACVVAGS